jgi:phosphoserine/homoserine phosphotransferase
MRIICLDLEGVLVPEIWINVAKRTGIKALERTTRDEPDYNKLMQYRIEILHDNKLSLSDIQEVITGMDPFEGACDFLNTLRSRSQVAILSDTFVQFAKPLMEKLGWPLLFCNSLLTDEDHMVVDYVLRQEDGKRKAVLGFKSMNLEVFASGDSYNDLAMIRAADRGALFHPPIKIVDDNPDIPVFRDYHDLADYLLEDLAD